MIKFGDKIEVTIDASYTKSYVETQFWDCIVYEGTVIEEDESIWPDCIFIRPSELDQNKNFFPKFRIIPRKNIINLIKINDDQTKEKIDVDDIEEKKVRTWNVKGSKGDIYSVIMNKNSTFTCNCYAGLMNRLCKHVKAVKKSIGVD